jgi:hypothetical protein
MKSKNLFLDFIWTALNFGWFANIFLAILGFIILTALFASRDYLDASVKYPLKPAVSIPSLTNAMAVIVPSSANHVPRITVQADDALIKFQQKTTIPIVVCSYFFLIAIEVLMISIIYNLRKVFSSIKENVPFKEENIKRLKIIALCFTLFTPLSILLSIASYQILAANIPGYHQQFQIIWQDSFSGLWIGIAIYVTTYVFKIGFELQKENGEFI